MIDKGTLFVNLDTFKEYIYGDDYKSPAGWDNAPTLEVLTADRNVKPENQVFDQNTHILTVGYEIIDNVLYYAVRPLTTDERSIALERAKVSQSYMINISFNEAENTTLDIGGVTYWPSIESAFRIDGARRAVVEAIAAGLKPEGTPVVFTDSNREPHSMTTAEALTVCLLLAEQAQTDFQKRQAKLVEINKAETAAEVLAVTW